MSILPRVPATALDAFGRYSTSQPYTIFDSKQIADNRPLIWDDRQLSGSGTLSVYLADTASTRISVSASIAGRRVRQTFRRFNYQPGKAQEVNMTGILSPAATGITSRMGLYDDNDGIFLQVSSVGAAFVIRSFVTGAAVNNTILRANWDDPMDGTGASGVNLDLTKTQIFWFDFEWLGVGTVRFGFFHEGVRYIAHTVHHNNVAQVVYMSTPNLPLRYEIENDGTGADGDVSHICTTVISNGGRENTGRMFGIDRTTALNTNNNQSFYPLVAMRLKTGYYLGATIQLLGFSITCNSTSDYAWRIILNPTIVGTALSFAGVTNAAVETDVTVGSGTTVTGGTILNAGIARQSSDAGIVITMQNDFALGANAIGTRDVIVLAVSRLTGTSETFYGAVNWQEEI
jgi:hypothetical protein